MGLYAYFVFEFELSKLLRGVLFCPVLMGSEILCHSRFGPSKVDREVAGLARLR